MTQNELIQNLEKRGALKTPRIIEAFRRVDRGLFVPEEYRALSYEDSPLPVGFGATISEPHTVAFMLELLSFETGNTILDIGSGSGWTTALLAHIAGESGKVYGMDVIPELIESAENRIGYHYPELADRIQLFSMNAKRGLPQYAPFDRIQAAASLQKRIPLSWKKQLRVGGRIVAQVKDEIIEIKKLSEAKYETKTHSGFILVSFQNE